jgi:hypothetical protein
MEGKVSIDMLYLMPYLEGSEKDDASESKEEEEAFLEILLAESGFYARKEEAGVFLPTGNLYEYEDGYVMTFDNEQAMEAACRKQPVCGKCFAEFVRATKSTLDARLPSCLPKFMLKG